MNIYTETILDHYQNPHHFGKLKKPSIRATENNPLCGDSLTLELEVKNGLIKNIAFSGNGCAISQAAMSMLTDMVMGKKISVVRKIKPIHIYNLLQISISPARKNCALLGLYTLQKILSK